MPNILSEKDFNQQMGKMMVGGADSSTKQVLQTNDETELSKEIPEKLMQKIEELMQNMEPSTKTWIDSFPKLESKNTNKTNDETRDDESKDETRVDGDDYDDDFEQGGGAEVDITNNIPDHFDLSKRNNMNEDKFFNFWLTGIANDKRPAVWIRNMLDDNFEVNYQTGNDVFLDASFSDNTVPKGTVDWRVTNFIVDMYQRSVNLQYHDGDRVGKIRNMLVSTPLNITFSFSELLAILARKNKIPLQVYTNFRRSNRFTLEQPITRDKLNVFLSILYSLDLASRKGVARCSDSLNNFLQLNKNHIVGNAKYMKFLNKFYEIFHAGRSVPWANIATHDFTANRVQLNLKRDYGGDLNEMLFNSILPILNKPDANCCINYTSIEYLDNSVGAKSRENITSVTVARLQEAYSIWKKRDNNFYTNRFCEITVTNDPPFPTFDVITFNAGARAVFEDLQSGDSSAEIDRLVDQFITNNQDHKIQYVNENGKLFMTFEDQQGKTKKHEITLNNNSFFADIDKIKDDQRRKCNTLQLGLSRLECNTLADYLKHAKVSDKWTNDFLAIIQNRNWQVDDKLFDTSQIYPYYMIKLLSALNFEKAEVVANNQTLNSVEDVVTWTERLESTVRAKAEQAAIPNQAAVDAIVNGIKNNSNLIHYLEMVVSFVQEYPEILNEGYNDQSEDKNRRLGIGKKGLYAVVPPFLATLQKDDVEFDVSNHHPFSTADIAHYNYPIIVSSSADQFGGGWFEKEKIMNQKPKSWGAALLKQMYDDSMAQLRQRNKDLSTKDKNNIDRLINNLGKLEEKLFRLVSIISKFNEHVSSNPTDNKSEVIRIADINSRLSNTRESLDNKYRYKQLNMLNIISAIRDIGRESKTDPKPGIVTYTRS